MSRTTKLLIFATLAFVLLCVTGLISYEVFAPKLSYGAGAPQAQTTVAGWLQLALASLGTAGFTAAGAWQLVAKYLEPIAGVKATAGAIDFAKVAAILAIIGKLPDGPTKASLTMAGRASCDELRDSLFPIGATP